MKKDDCLRFLVERYFYLERREREENLGLLLFRKDNYSYSYEY